MNYQEYVEQSLDHADYEAALGWIDKWNSVDPVELRIRGYYQGRVLFRQGEYQKAIQVFRETIESYGEHVSLLGEIACCYCQLGDLSAWSQAFGDLVEAFERAKPLLGEESLFLIGLLIAKFYEEEGQVAEAMSQYESLKTDLRISSSEEYVYFLSAQRLRIQAEYLGADCVEVKPYQWLMGLSENRFNPYVHVEIQHALIRVESVMINSQQAVRRWHHCLNDGPRLNREDRDFLLLELAEALLRQGSEIPSEVLAALGQMKGLTTYQDLVVACSTKVIKLSHIDKALMGGGMFPSQQLKSLELIKPFCNESQAQQLSRRYHAIRKGLSRDSQKYWAHYFSGIKSEELVEIQLNESLGQLQLKGEEVSFKSRRTSLELLCALLDKPRWPLEEYVRHQWNSDYDSTYYHRLRMMVKRINEALLPISAKPIIHCSQEGLWVDSGFQLKRSSS